MGQGRRPQTAPWRERLGHFLASCTVSGPADQPARLREACGLFPDAAGPAGQALEAMIAAHAYDSAALALIGERAGYTLSRGGNGVCLASIYLPGCHTEHTCEGDTPALALLAAAATALLEVCAEAGSPQRKVPHLN